MPYRSEYPDAKRDAGGVDASAARIERKTMLYDRVGLPLVLNASGVAPQCKSVREPAKNADVQMQRFVDGA